MENSIVVQTAHTAEMVLYRIVKSVMTEIKLTMTFVPTLVLQHSVVTA